MRKASNVLVGLMAAGVCAFMTWISFGAGLYTFAYNLGFLGLMLIIILLGAIFGFRRMGQTVRGLDRASRKLMSIYKNKESKSELLEMTRAGAEIFEVEYLDHKYQEYLGYLRKTNSPCDIGDYIGEYEINNYTHRRLIEMIPDILTSFGILGTFMGLVWGLRGFNPVSYEAMASSITSLIDGIKIAFVTSIYGIALSMAFSYWTRGALTNVSESLDNFLDKYYLSAVSPTDATAMNHVLANQKEQIRAIDGMGDNLSETLAVSLSQHVDPVMNQMNRTLENFTDVVTLNQQELLENIASQVMGSMRREFFSEFAEMRTILKDTNQAQKEYLKYMAEAQSQLAENLKTGTSQMAQVTETTAAQMRRAAEGSAAQQKQTIEELKTQQEHLTQFVDYMTQVMGRMQQFNEKTANAVDALAGQVERMGRLSDESAKSAAAANEALGKAVAAVDAVKAAPSAQTKIQDVDQLTERMDQMIELLEQQLKNQKNRKGIFR